MESHVLKTFLEQPLLDREGLAMKLGVSTDTVANWTSEKRIPCFRFGHRTCRYSYPAVVTALAKYYRAPEQHWTRKLPAKRKRLLELSVKAFQTEMVLEGEQLLFPFVSQLFDPSPNKNLNF